MKHGAWLIDKDGKRTAAVWDGKKWKPTADKPAAKKASKE